MVENNAHKISFIVIFGSGLYKNILKKLKRYLKNLDERGNKKMTCMQDFGMPTLP